MNPNPSLSSLRHYGDPRTLVMHGGEQERSANTTAVPFPDRGQRGSEMR
jgi:hypothetical protein